TPAPYQAPGKRGGQDEPGGSKEGRYEGVVGVRLEGESGVRVGGPAEGQGGGELATTRSRADAEAEPDQQGEGGEVEGDRGAMGGGQVVPTAVPGPDRLEGNVGEVVDGTVGVALGDVGGEVVVERFAVGYPVGADHPRVADVDRSRVGHVEPDPEADQEEGGDPQPGRRPDGPDALAAAVQSDPQRPAEQVEERRVLEGD